jgi:hypothetical protein
MATQRHRIRVFTRVLMWTRLASWHCACRPSANGHCVLWNTVPQRHGVRLARVGIIVAVFATWLLRTYNVAFAVSLSASRHPVSGESAPTGADGVTLRVAFRRQRAVRVHVERCEADIKLLGSPPGALDVGPQVGWALTQALHATDDGNSLASGNEVSYQVSFWAPYDRALDVKVIASGAPAILRWVGWPAWSASIIIPPAVSENPRGWR